MTGINKSILITEEVGDSGSWLHDPDNWDDGDFSKGEYALFKAIQVNEGEEGEFNITHMPGASAFSFPVEERITRVTFVGIITNLSEYEDIKETWVLHTDFNDLPLYLVVLDNTISGNQYLKFWDDERTERSYLKGKWLRLSRPFQARRREYRFTGVFEGVWD